MKNALLDIVYTSWIEVSFMCFCCFFDFCIDAGQPRESWDKKPPLHKIEVVLGNRVFKLTIRSVVCNKSIA